MTEKSSPPFATLGESPDEWYEREKTAFRAWWESEGAKTFSRTTTLAAGAGWFARAEAASETAPIVPCLATNGCTTPEWCARNGDACRVKTPVSETPRSEPTAWAIFASDTHEMIDLSLIDPDEAPGQYVEPLFARSATPCSGQHLSKDLQEALEFIKKLSAVISATPPDAFKGWARGENAPYDLAKAADNFVHQPRSVFPPSSPDGEFTVGDYTMREGMERGKVWIEHESGEGGDFTASKVEEAIAAFYKEHF